MSRANVVRLLTLLSFFNFSGLNNGFTFMFSQAQAVQPLCFAPVALRSLCVAVNPFVWKSRFTFRKLSRVLFGTTRMLEISSQKALQRYHPKVLSSNFTSWGLNIRNVFQFRGHLAGTSPWFPSQPILSGCEPPLQNAQLKNVSYVQPQSHAVLKRTDEHKPGDMPDLSPLIFNLIPIPNADIKIKIHALIEKQTSLPASQRLRLWRNALGMEDDASTFYFRSDLTHLNHPPVKG